MYTPHLKNLNHIQINILSASDMTWGGFNWKLNFRWYRVPQRELDRRNGDRYRVFNKELDWSNWDSYWVYRSRIDKNGGRYRVFKRELDWSN